MSQSGLTDKTREAEWDRWYIEHLRIMSTVPGVSSAQRFKTDTPGFPPSLAIYSIASPAVFDGPYYQSVRGMGVWLALIDRQHYKRNLFSGLEHAPLIADTARLLVTDREHGGQIIAGIEFIWLKSAGLDRSTPYRGIAVIEAAQPAPLDPLIAVYRPVTPRMTSVAG